MAVKQDIDVGMVAFIGLIGSMLLLISVFGVQAWFAYEVALLDEVRYDTDKNLEWISLRDEQYANIGDSVGNQIVYSAADPPDRQDIGSPAWGYRWTSEARDQAAIPIHEAMAQIVQQYGQQQVSAQQMREANRIPVTIVNEAFFGYMTPNRTLLDRDGPTQRQPGPHGDRPAPERGTGPELAGGAS